MELELRLLLKSCWSFCGAESVKLPVSSRLDFFNSGTVDDSDDINSSTVFTANLRSSVALSLYAVSSNVVLSLSFVDTIILDDFTTFPSL